MISHYLHKDDIAKGGVYYNTARTERRIVTRLDADKVYFIRQSCRRGTIRTTGAGHSRVSTFQNWSYLFRS